MPHVIVLAAGKGARMRSELPKVLHPVDGVPMIERVLKVADALAPRPIIVVGHRATEVMRAVGEDRAYALQVEQRGTGDAVRCALAAFPAEDGAVVVLPGDHPFVTADTIRRLVDAREADDAAVALATARLPDFDGPRAQFSSCGRIIRDADGSVSGIVERKDATKHQARIREVNVSYYCFRADWLKENIDRIVSDNAAGERYLTDLVAAAASQGERISDIALHDLREGMGVNTPEQLEAAAFA
ncbi:MAG TPA: NTP transferase domain-containing protein [Candidatus Baltobacteraceae bacterium]|nr:NTP transferase domain-containing protein [Candidatus Baltobacteraceae bacterium]